jgi:hypothetical protein
MTLRNFIIFSVIAAAIVGVTLVYLNSNEFAPHRQTVSIAAPAVPLESTQEPTPPEPTSVPSQTQQTSPTPAVTPVALPEDPEITEDDRKIHAIISAQLDNNLQGNTTTAQNLINLLPTLKPLRQAECAQHIANLLDDSEYRRALPIWRNSGFNKEVLEVLATDLMNRSDTVKLPAMLDALRQPTHPFNEEAKSLLTIFLDNDYGSDWTKWEGAIKTYLAEQAAPELPAGAAARPNP